MNLIKQYYFHLKKHRDKLLEHYFKANWLYCASLVCHSRHKVETLDVSDWGGEIKHAPQHF